MELMVIVVTPKHFISKNMVLEKMGYLVSLFPQEDIHIRAKFLVYNYEKILFIMLFNDNCIIWLLIIKVIEKY